MSEPNQPFLQPEESNLFNEQRPVVYGSFWERFGAFFIDRILASLIAYIVGLAAGFSISPMSGTSFEGFGSPESALSYAAASMSISLLVEWLYYALFHSGPWQATPGKRALGLKVTNLHGERISFLNATGRYFATLLSSIILLIGFFMMLWDDRRQTLHDKLAGTLVVKA